MDADSLFDVESLGLNFQNVETADFDKVKTRLEKIPALSDQLRFLEKVKIEFEAEQGERAIFSHEQTFRGKLVRAKERVERLIKLEKEHQATGNLLTESTSEELPNENRSKPGLSLVVCARVLSLLFDAAKTSEDSPTATDKAEAIEALTGYSANKIRQRLSRLEQRTTKQTNADIAKAQEILRKLKLDDLAKKMERDKK